MLCVLQRWCASQASNVCASMRARRLAPQVVALGCDCKMRRHSLPIFAGCKTAGKDSMRQRMAPVCKSRSF